MPSCSTCGVELDSEFERAEHISSLKHKINDSKKGGPTENLFCEVCNCMVADLGEYSNHVRSPKHIACLKRERKRRTALEDINEPDSDLGNDDFDEGFPDTSPVKKFKKKGKGKKKGKKGMSRWGNEKTCGLPPPTLVSNPPKPTIRPMDMEWPTAGQYNGNYGPPMVHYPGPPPFFFQQPPPGHYYSEIPPIRGIPPPPHLPPPPLPNRFDQMNQQHSFSRDGDQRSLFQDVSGELQSGSGLVRLRYVDDVDFAKDDGDFAKSISPSPSPSPPPPAASKTPLKRKGSKLLSAILPSAITGSKKSKSESTETEEVVKKKKKVTRKETPVAVKEMGGKEQKFEKLATRNAIRESDILLRNRMEKYRLISRSEKEAAEAMASSGAQAADPSADYGGVYVGSKKVPESQKGPEKTSAKGTLTKANYVKEMAEVPHSTPIMKPSTAPGFRPTLDEQWMQTRNVPLISSDTSHQSSSMSISTSASSPSAMRGTVPVQNRQVERTPSSSPMGDGMLSPVHQPLNRAKLGGWSTDSEPHALNLPPVSDTYSFVDNQLLNVKEEDLNNMHEYENAGRLSALSTKECIDQISETTVKIDGAKEELSNIDAEMAAIQARLVELQNRRREVVIEKKENEDLRETIFNVLRR